MFKGIWRSSPSKASVVTADLPLLSDPDHEYLFMQLLEGVTHGWQQPRVIKFFQRVKQRAPKSQWVTWLNGFGYRLLNSNDPNEELARKMIILGELDCGEVTTLAGEFGHQILGKIYGGVDEESLPDLDISSLRDLELTLLDQENFIPAPPPMAFSEVETGIGIRSDHREERRMNPPPPPAPPRVVPLDFDPVTLPNTDILNAKRPTAFSDSNGGFNFDPSSIPTTHLDIPMFGVVPSELRIAKDRGLLPIEPYSDQPAALEEQVISIEEFATMLQSDPSLVREVAQQMGINTNDPQVVLDAVINQMQQQIQDGNE
jgi:hypothetical protein